ncbi:10396_t:CDS:2 [Entrophospora sp. SA101]|nr:10396_t:CDS:2 [Entrophospora sp. SA101]
MEIIEQVDENTLLLNQYLKKVKTPLILLLNKVDLEEFEEKTSSYQVLGAKYCFSISALNGTNCDKLTQEIINLLPSPRDERIVNPDKNLNLLIFGPPNSGKSTLMNYLLQENRSLATSIAGTTQEPVITIIDASSPLTKQILQIVNLGEKYNKPLIIIVNKCDLIKSKKELVEEIKFRLKSLSYCPIICLSALKGTGIDLLMKNLEELITKSQKKFTRKELEETTAQVLANNPPKYHKGGKLKIYFAKQEPGLVQHFIFFVNNPQWTHFSYQRYITNYLRKHLGLEYLPIKRLEPVKKQLENVDKDQVKNMLSAMGKKPSPEQVNRILSNVENMKTKKTKGTIIVPKNTKTTALLRPRSRKAKGYFGSKRKLFKTAKEQLMNAKVDAYSGRKQKKRDFRRKIYPNYTIQITNKYGLQILVDIQIDKKNPVPLDKILQCEVREGQKVSPKTTLFIIYFEEQVISVVVYIPWQPKILRKISKKLEKGNNDCFVKLYYRNPYGKFH